MKNTIQHLKKQAKNLHKLLPEYIQKNTDGGNLAAAQELMARVNGYPNWHAAVNKLTAENDGEGTCL